MDILKKAYTNLTQCEISGDSVSISGKQYDGLKTVDFPTKKTKEYNLKSVIFFLLNSDKSLKDYMAQCKTNGVVPISYVDKAHITSEIEAYELRTLKGFFIEPEYVQDRVFDIPDIHVKDLIVVPGNITSSIHIENTTKLLIDGTFEASYSDPLSETKKEVLLGNKTFYIVKNGTGVDWRRVKAVFIDDSKKDESKDILKHCTREITVFTLSNENFKSIKLEIGNGILKNRSTVLSALNVAI